MFIGQVTQRVGTEPSTTSFDLKWIQLGSATQVRPPPPSLSPSPLPRPVSLGVRPSACPNRCQQQVGVALHAAMGLVCSGCKSF